MGNARNPSLLHSSIAHDTAASISLLVGTSYDETSELFRLYWLLASNAGLAYALKANLNPDHNKVQWHYTSFENGADAVLTDLTIRYKVATDTTNRSIATVSKGSLLGEGLATTSLMC